ncbi:MAG: CDP-diacylglycerol--serine O-phosphatidyltransferase [Desulfobulbaceae bacterium A2]|nr:MAG: CDP-diacylglycerol--serine O-phosphatidyltransferase [Desulfobulbaceae bacterium A2]
MDTEQTVQPPPSAKFYVLPNMLTLASLFCGFYSIVSGINGHFRTAAIAILVAAVFDSLDGRVARMTRTTSQFGVELDSLCDLVSFGVAPGVLAYLWALQPYGRYGWLAAFLYLATTALRLARFNCQTASGNKNFVGLPCPAAAGMIATTVMFSRFLGASGTVKHLSILLLVYLLSYLMVSTHCYVSFKHPETRKRKTFQVLVGGLLVFVLAATEPDVTLFVITAGYVASGPILALYHILTRSRTATAEKDSLKSGV